MCGIGGIVGDSSGLDAAALLASLKHRGPDRQASVEPSPGVWLGATRLAISDPTSAGDQPMRTPDGQLSVVHNGEIYNAPELRRELEGRGARFRSRCDTEVILLGYREWGEGVVARLEGMFAFGLWDAPRQRLLLARDPLGIKPLWLARGARRLVFASEVRSLLRARAATPSLSPISIRSFLASGSVAEPHGLIAGVEALPPGHHLLYSDGRETLACDWTLPDERAAAPNRETAAEMVRERLDAAVHGCLEADVPVALLLSGGIDSAALAHVAGAGRNIRSFHVRVGDRMAARAAQLARSLGFQHEEVALDGAEVRADLLHLLAAQDLPSVDGVNTYLIAQAIRKAGLKAAVTGLGADELFLGYTLHRTYVRARTLQAEGALGAPLRFAAGVLSRWKAGAPARGPLAGWQLDKALGLASVDGARNTYAAARALFPAAIAMQLQPECNYPALPPRGMLPPGASPVAEVTRLELSTYLVDTLLRDADVMGMAHGVELRVPMLDRRLVEAVVALPGGLKLRRGRQKALLVDAVPELPTELTRATKEGFELPLEEWLAGPLRAPVESLLCTPAAALRVGLAPDRVADVWQRFIGSRSRPGAFRAWALFSLLEWARAHGASV